MRLQFTHFLPGIRGVHICPQASLEGSCEHPRYRKVKWSERAHWFYSTYYCSNYTEPKSLRLRVDNSESSHTITWTHQRHIPELPIPLLEVTCRRYPTALKGLQDTTRWIFFGDLVTRSPLAGLNIEYSSGRVGVAIGNLRSGKPMCKPTHMRASRCGTRLL